jgi:hypothetical protein
MLHLVREFGFQTPELSESLFLQFGWASNLSESRF